MKKHQGWMIGVALAVIAISAPQASASELVLKYATLDSPAAHLNVYVHHPWAAKVNKDTHGLFRIEVFDGEALANQRNIYNRVVSNVVQIGWGLPALEAGKFPLLNVVDLPGVSTSSQVASVALWRLYKTGLLDKEFDEIVPLKLIVFPQGGLQYRKKPATLDNLRGLKVLSGSKIGSEVVRALGGAPLSLPIDEYYEALQRGTADGVVTPWTAFQPFKLAEVTHFHLDMPLGSAAGYVFMARKEWNTLPEAARKILLANSGEAESRAFGHFWDNVEREGRATTLKKPNQTLLHLTAAQKKNWDERLSAIPQEWAKSVPGGEKVLATYRKLLSDVEAGK